jgi:hypothetical protein
LEFDVTPATQMSPALAKVVREVRGRYMTSALFAGLRDR